MVVRETQLNYSESNHSVSNNSVSSGNEKTGAGTTVVKDIEDSPEEIEIQGKKINLNDGDEIARLGLATERVELTPEIDRKLVRKIDMFLLPLMSLLYCFQFLDKLSNSYASIMGLREDLNMTGDKYSWTGSAFYIGYLFFEFPASLALQKFPLAKTIGCFVVFWGVILCLHSVAQYPGFIALRTILGMAESSITPGFLLLTAQYYTKLETYLRVALWFSFNGLGLILGSGMAYGLAIHDHSMELWKLVFIISGVLTISLGLMILLHMPDTPAKAWFLTDEDKKYLVERIRENQQGFGNKHFKKDQFIEALTDVNTWIIAVFSIASNIPNGGITNFGSILLHEDFGYSETDALLYQMISGAVELVGCIAIASLSSWYKSRMVWGVLGMCIALLGQYMLAFSPTPKARFAGYNLNFVAPCAFFCVISCIATNTVGSTKKSTVNAIFLIAYCVGNLSGSQTFLPNEAPTYTTAKICIATFGTVALVCLLALWFSYFWENKRRDKNPIDVPQKAGLEFADLTDRQNPYFRYSY